LWQREIIYLETGCGRFFLWLKTKNFAALFPSAVDRDRHCEQLLKVFCVAAQ